MMGFSGGSFPSVVLEPVPAGVVDADDVVVVDVFEVVDVFDAVVSEDELGLGDVDDEGGGVVGVGSTTLVVSSLRGQKA